MRKKKNQIFIIILLIGILSFYGFKNYAKKVKDEHCLTTQISSRLFDLNSVELLTKGNLTENDIKIINNNSGKVVFENGINKKGIKNEHGFSGFTVFYKGVEEESYAFFKENNWQTFTYQFVLELKNERITGKMNVFRASKLVESSNGGRRKR